MSGDNDELLVDDDGRLRIITLNRPNRMNALTPELHHRLQSAVVAAANDPDVGAVALTGAGQAFCSGGDVRKSTDEAAKADRPETVEERADSIMAHGRTVITLHRMGKPTIALINGAAAGSGMALALACDMRVMAEGAIMRTAYARIGLSGDLGLSYFLNRLAGPAKASELLYLNAKVSAEECLGLGLANLVFSAETFESEAFGLARKLANGPTVAFRCMKQNLQTAASASLEQTIEREAYNTARCVRTKDVKEAALAFREKRDPAFKGM
ncbi:enoyl-CoA hydratase-related protein [Hyphomonas johnsonii]|nr:enoyl-CoA hydratase-related protein [Hyphomonas johnsonii]